MSKTWFITGASRGLGAALATVALEAGDNVAATARSLSQLNSLVERYGSRVLPLTLDVNNESEIPVAIQKTMDAFGKLDVVVNNAGYANVDAIETVDMKDFRTQFETNFFAAVNVSRTVIPIMRKQGSGHIIQIATIGDRLGVPGIASYVSSKWAMAGFSVSLQEEVKPFGVKVTVCEPGNMRTDWGGSSMTVAKVAEGYESTVGAHTEFRKSLADTATDPEKIAKAIVYITNVQEPPMRLLLGADVPAYAKMTLDNLAESDEKWAGVTTLKVIE